MLWNGRVLWDLKIKNLLPVKGHIVGQSKFKIHMTTQHMHSLLPSPQTAQQSAVLWGEEVDGYLGGYLPITGFFGEQKLGQSM